MMSNTPPPTRNKYVLPQDPLFTRLLILASRHCSSPKPAIIDLNAGISATLAEVLSDVIHLRSAIRSRLSSSTLNALESNGREEVYVHLLAPGGYEFTVGVLAILALGAACSALSTAQPVNELTYYARKSKAVGVVTSTAAAGTGQRLADEISSSSDSNTNFFSLPVSAGLYPGRPRITLDQVVIDIGGYRDPNAPGVVIFTSGTTGPPKAAVLRRASITDGALGWAEQLGLTSKDHVLHLLPVHHATGIWVSFFPFLQTGATIEYKPGSFDPEWTWKRWREGGLSHFTGVPTIYMRMMRYYNNVIAKLDPAEIQAYAAAAADIKVMMCGTSALPKPINDFWTSLRRGRRIVQRYGSTELGVGFNMPFESNESVPDGSVGEVSIGVDIKLSTDRETEGEVLGKSFNMFSKYLHDPAATAAAFDDQGYFRTGDIARREGKNYFIVGRASVDIVKSGGYKISALDVEREVLALPYVGECMVVGVPDDEFGQRVGCVIVTLPAVENDDDDDDKVQDLLTATSSHQKSKKKKKKKKLTLDDLRNDLRHRLAGYKLPTLLRVVDGELPKSGTGKIVKKTLGPVYFPPKEYVRDPEVQVWNPSGWGKPGIKAKL